MVENKKVSDLEILYNIYKVKNKTRSLYQISHDINMPVSSLYLRLKKLVKKGLLIKKRRERKTVFLLNPVFIKQKDRDSIVLKLLPVLTFLKNSKIDDVGLAINFFLYISTEI